MSRLFASLLLFAASLGAADDARRPEVERAIARLSPTIVRIEVISEDGSEGRMLRQHAVGSGAIIDAQFHPRICNRRKLAVWFAFFGNPMHRKFYQATATGIDDERMDVVTDLCAVIISDGDFSGVDARDVAATLEGLFDGLWLNILMYPDRFSADGAKAKVVAYLAAIFPAHFGGHQVSG